MARNSSQMVSMDLDSLNEILRLESTQLLEKVVQILNQKFGSVSTRIFEFDKLRFSVNVLACAGKAGACRKDIEPYLIRLIEHVGDSNSPYCVFSRSDPTPNFSGYNLHNSLFDSNVTDGFIGVQLKDKQGETIGLLLSEFDSTFTGKPDICTFHYMLASFASNGLREKGLSERSEALVTQLNYELSHDNLTGLLNRNHLSKHLSVLMEEGGISFTLAFIDIDNFKSINDLYGSYIGDQILKFVADTISSCVPEPHSIYRTAGDEFAFITHNRDPNKICEAIITRLDLGFNDASRNIKIGVNIGIAQESKDTACRDEVILNASLALKDCKKKLNQSIQFYDTALNAKYYRRAQIISTLRAELSRPIDASSELYVLAQPIVNKDSSQWHYFEILARWNSKTLGKISPLEFIAAAEQSGLIVELGERIIQLACITKRKLETGLNHKITLGINCSAYELNDSSRYLTHILKTIQYYQFLPNEFVIELTETVLLSDVEEVRETLNKMREHGFSIALDDFGTGYSSLNYIHRYPIDCIKIDASFIRNMSNNDTAEKVVRLIIKLAKQLNVTLVAEGVEHQATLARLHTMGCKNIQGYYYSKPDTPENIIEQQTPHLNQYCKIANG